LYYPDVQVAVLYCTRKADYEGVRRLKYHAVTGVAISRKLADGRLLRRLHKQGHRSSADIQAEKTLQKLASQYSKTFTLKRLGDTHAKILISDTKFAVTTSFYWLSFKGERDRTFRDERGTLVSDPQKIDELFDNLLKRLTNES
jgi:hypothetical protein